VRVALAILLETSLQFDVISMNNGGQRDPSKLADLLLPCFVLSAFFLGGGNLDSPSPSFYLFKPNEPSLDIYLFFFQIHLLSLHFHRFCAIDCARTTLVVPVFCLLLLLLLFHKYCVARHPFITTRCHSTTTTTTLPDDDNTGGAGRPALLVLLLLLSPTATPTHT